MEFDFSDLKTEIAKTLVILLAQAYEDEDGFHRGVAPSLSRKIGRTLKPYLDQVTPESPPELLREMEFLYSNMIFLTPPLSLGYIVKGQFHSALKQFNQAAECFRGAYDIERDPTRKKWPHLQATERNARLMVWLGYSLYHSGEQEEGEKFFKIGHRILENVAPRAKTDNPPEPA